ncbi:MAG: 30S ribosomal protein S13 [Candidatus Pacebacteria bacterium]|nr:30S ribosomal protein S13 [Candidatus Paceibacterota bacterium]
MPRIAGQDIPDHKKVAYALRYIYGVGPHRSQQLVKQAKIDPEKRARDLTSDEINKLQKLLEEFPTEGDLRRIVSDNVNRLIRIKSYRGTRHAKGLPVRGQQTRTNARTKRGKRRTVGAMTKELATKMEQAKKA